MIDELKRQIAEIERDLKPVLAHVAAATARRDALAAQVAKLEAVDKVVPETPVVETPAVEVSPEMVVEPKRGKR